MSSKAKSKKNKEKIAATATPTLHNSHIIDYLVTLYKKILLEKKKNNIIPCVENKYRIGNEEKVVNYRSYKEFMNKLGKNENLKMKDENRKAVKMCKVNPYNQYLKSVSSEGLFMNLRKYHQNIKQKYIKKYAFHTPLLVDIGSSQLKSMRFWKAAFVKRVIAMEPSQELYDLGMKFMRRDYYGKKSVVFLRAVGEKHWVDGSGGLNEFSANYLKNMIARSIKANVITFEFTFHYMIYNMKVLMENIKSISKSGTKVIIHCINGDFLMNEFKTKDKYEVRKGDIVTFYAEKNFKNISESKSRSKSKSLNKLLDLKEVNIYFRGAQGLNNVIQEYLILKDDITRVFEKYGFQLLEFLPFSEQNYKNFGLEEYEFDVSKIYTTYVFEYK